MFTAIYHKDNRSYIKWRLTEACNYKCSYCIRRISSGYIQDEGELTKDWKMCKNVIPSVNRLIEELPGCVKLDLIGGEVTLLPLTELIYKLTSSKLKVLHITTNLSASTSYYVELLELCKSRGIRFELTASYHSEFTKLSVYIDKLNILKEYIGNYFGIKGETVFHTGNFDNIYEYISNMKTLGLSYNIDVDKTQYVCDLPEMDLTYKKETVFYVYMEDGSVQSYSSKTEAVRKLSGGHKYILTKSMYCTRGYNFIYIDKNNVIGPTLSRINKGSVCKHIIPIQYYHVLRHPIQCTQTGCTLCGHMSIAQDKNDLINYVNGGLK